jgi:hypothetical protein
MIRSQGVASTKGKITKVGRLDTAYQGNTNLGSPYRSKLWLLKWKIG